MKKNDDPFGWAHSKIEIDEPWKVALYTIVMTGKIAIDVFALLTLMSGEALSIVAAPASAGASAVIAFALLEAIALSGIALVSDIVELTENVTKYSKEGKVTIDVDFLPKSSKLTDLFEYLVL